MAANARREGLDMARRVNYRDAAIWQRSVVKRTFQAGAQTDAFDPKRTWRRFLVHVELESATTP
jgi:hypothetical protein